MESGKIGVVQPEKVLGDIKAPPSTKRAAQTSGNCILQLKDTALLSGRGRAGTTHCRKALTRNRASISFQYDRFQSLRKM